MIYGDTRCVCAECGGIWFCPQTLSPPRLCPSCARQASQQYRDHDKHDAGKPRWDLLPFKATEAVVKVLTHGATKYKPHGWKDVAEPRQRYFAACLRHVVAWWGGETNDAESGLPHLAHAICCLMFLLERGDG